MRSLAFVVVCALSGCSLFVSLDGLDDGAAIVNDGGGNDASSPRDSAIFDAPISTDGGSDGSTTSVCPPGALLCDDFETGDFSKWDTISPASLPSLFEVTTAKAWRGSHAMHVDVVDDSDAGNVYNLDALKSFAPISSGTLAVRAYVFTTNELFSGAFLVLGHGVTPAQTLVLGVTNGATCPSSGDCVGNALVGSASSDFTDGANVAFPSGKWVCLEWVVVVGTSGSATAYADGATLLQSVHDTSDPGGGYTSLSVGFIGASAGQELFYDDVAIAPARMGCE